MRIVSSLHTWRSTRSRKPHNTWGKNSNSMIADTDFNHCCLSHYLSVYLSYNTIFNYPDAQEAQVGLGDQDLHGILCLLSVNKNHRGKVVKL